MEKLENRYKINYDLKQRVITSIKFKQGNIDSSTLEIKLLDNGITVDITGEAIEFRFMKPDDTVVYQDSTTGVNIIDAINGSFECVLKSNTLAAAGNVKCEIHRTKDGKELTTPAFYFYVENSIGSDGILSSNYIGIIENKIIDWQTEVDVMKAEYDGFKTAQLAADKVTYFQDEINKTNESLNDIVHNVKAYGAKGDGATDDTQAFINAINAIKTTEYTEASPAQNAKGKILIPAGIYKISSKISLPSYISLEGNGRNTTILKSYITNGDPVIEVIQGIGTNRQFYNSIKGLTIEGNGQACKGLRIYNTSRWILDDILINNTLHEGLYLYNCCLGEVRSCLVRACGDATHYSVKYDGPSSNSGPNSVTWFGGEINGGGSSVNGLDIYYANTVSFFGTAIEGFANGLGVLNENGQAVMFSCVHFEANKGHCENAAAYCPVFTGCFFSVPTVGALGHIIVKSIYGGKIEGNFFAGTGFTHIVAKDPSSVLQYSSIQNNYVSAFPIIIDPILITSALNSGTIIETFDANGHVVRYGQQQFHDVMECLADFKPTGGIKNISGFTRSNIVGNNGSPEGVVAADPGSICMNGSDTTDRSTSIYLKANGVNSAYGWLPLQVIQAGTTANRPTVTTTGYMYFDATLGKPIWWNGAVWKDATGATV